MQNLNQQGFSSAQPFMFMLTFNLAERAQAMYECTDGVLGLRIENGNASSLVISVDGTDKNAKLVSRQIESDGKASTSDRLLRDSNEFWTKTEYKYDLKQAVIVGIVCDTEGRPVMSFEARKLMQGWHVEGKKYKFHA